MVREFEGDGMKTIKPDAFRPSAGRANAYLSRRRDTCLATIGAALVLFVVLPTLLYLAVAGWVDGWEWQGAYNSRQDERTYQRILDYQEENSK